MGDPTLCAIPIRQSAWVSHLFFQPDNLIIPTGNDVWASGCPDYNERFSVKLVEEVKNFNETLNAMSRFANLAMTTDDNAAYESFQAQYENLVSFVRQIGEDIAVKNCLILGCGCGSVGRAVVFDARGQWFESSHQ